MGKVYVNRTLNLKKIKYIGLDMDHTLIRYHTEAFEELAHNIMLAKLYNDKGYPKQVLQFKFDFDRAIRGLVLDKEKGNALKLSRYAAIRVSYHGMNPLDYKEQQKIYKSTYIDLGDSNYDTVDTSFSIAFAGLFMQLVDFKDQNPTLNLPSYRQIADDLNWVLDRGHRDGSIKDVVQSDLNRFVIKDPETVAGLEKFKKHDKKIFVLTNSDFSYTKLLLDYAINPFLTEHQTWLDLFECVITLAQKPRFFYDQLQFLKIDPDTGTMTNHFGALTRGVYQGGCESTFTSNLKLNPEEILYIGDHIYGDIVRLKKDCAWRTALVVEELEDEVSKMQKAAPLVDQINQLMERKIPIETQIDELISLQIESGKDLRKDETVPLVQQVQAIDNEIKGLIKQQQSIYNPLWGEVMRAGIEESFFAYQMERFACIYMSKLMDLLNLCPRTYFRSSRRLLAHDIQPQKDASV